MAAAMVWSKRFPAEGQIGFEEKGENGFGYDPYFYTNEYAGRTMAELTLEEKTRISHRGRALRKLTQKLEEHLA